MSNTPFSMSGTVSLNEEQSEWLGTVLNLDRGAPRTMTTAQWQDHLARAEAVVGETKNAMLKGFMQNKLEAMKSTFMRS